METKVGVELDRITGEGESAKEIAACDQDKVMFVLALQDQGVGRVPNVVRAEPQFASHDRLPHVNLRRVATDLDITSREIARVEK